MRSEAIERTNSESPDRRGYWRLSYAAFLACCYIIVIWRQVLSGLEMDEAINLTVVKNLALGNGYATNTSLAPGTMFHLFDPIVSTGPTLLAPAAVVWRISNGNIELIRLVPILFFLLYLASLFSLTRKFWGIDAALVAITTPLLLNVGGSDLFSHGLSFGRFIGEFTVVALTVLAIRLLANQRTQVASLILGFAVLAKLNWLWMAVLVLLVWNLMTFSADHTWRFRRWLGNLGLLVLPSLGFELYKLLTLGVSGYRTSTNEYLGWLSGQGRGVVSTYLNDGMLSWPNRILGIVGSPTHKERLLGLFGLLSAPGLLLVLLALLFLIVSNLNSRVSIASYLAKGEDSRKIVLCLAIPGVAVVAWWLLGSSQASARLGLPFWLLILPLAGIVVFRLVTAIRFSEGRKSKWDIGFRWVAAGGFILLISFQVYSVAIDSAGRQLRDDQLSAAKVLKASGASAIPANWIWTNPEMQVFTDLPTADQFTGADGTFKVFTSVQALSEKGLEEASSYSNLCGSVVFSSRAILICK